MTKLDILKQIDEIFQKIDKLPDNADITNIQNQLGYLYEQVRSDPETQEQMSSLT